MRLPHREPWYASTRRVKTSGRSDPACPPSFSRAFARFLADATFTDSSREERPRADCSVFALRCPSVPATWGVDIVDVKIRRADLPAANSEAIFRRMRTEREQEATQIRAEGQEAARRITAAADRAATVLRAEAQRESEQIRGEGDAPPLGDLRQRLRARTRTSSRSSAPCRPTSRRSSRVTPASCCRPARNSSATSTIRMGVSAGFGGPPRDCGGKRPGVRLPAPAAPLRRGGGRPRRTRAPTSPSSRTCEVRPEAVAADADEAIALRRGLRSRPPAGRPRHEHPGDPRRHRPVVRGGRLPPSTGRPR